MYLVITETKPKSCFQSNYGRKKEKKQPPRIGKFPKQGKKEAIDEKIIVSYIEGEKKEHGVRDSIEKDSNTTEEKENVEQKKEENDANTSEKLGLHDSIMLKLAYDQYSEDVFEGLVHIYEHNRLLEEKKQQKLNQAESERTMYNQIDWQDFVVVSTLDFDPRDLGLVDSDSESESESDSEEEKEEIAKTETMKVEDIKDNSAGVISKPELVANDDDSEEGVYREQDDSEDDEEVVQIRDDYQISTAVGKSEQYSNKVLDPRTGQMIPLEDLEEYRRIQFMDPRYEIESKRAEDARKDTGYAGGAALVANLENVVRKRNALTALEEEEKLQRQEERARKRRMLERQKQDSLANKSKSKNENTIEDKREDQEDHDNSGNDQMMSIDQQSSVTKVEGRISISAPKIINTNDNIVPSVTIHPPISITNHDVPLAQSTNMLSDTVSSQSLQYPNIVNMGSQDVQSTNLSQIPPSNLPQQIPQQSLSEPSNIGEGQEMSEEKFLLTYGDEALYPRSQYTFLITFPSSASSATSQSQDPDIEITDIDPSWTVKELKSQIASKYEKLPLPKIQLRKETGAFLKDANTLAFYNLRPGSRLDVIPKTRGGRK